jgi:hypothetical protein
MQLIQIVSQKSYFFAEFMHAEKGMTSHKGYSLVKQINGGQTLQSVGDGKFVNPRLNQTTVRVI